MKITDPMMAANLKSKIHFLNMFFDFLSRFLRIWLQSFQKVLISQKNLLTNQRRYKNAEFHADF
jgi:hypothetical protein